METLLEFKAIIFIMTAALVTWGIYKLIPERSAVILEGPLKGINIKSTGPIAGFLLVSVMCNYTDNQIQSRRVQKEKEQKKDWAIRGNIVLLNPDGTKINGSQVVSILERLRADLISPTIPAQRIYQDRSKVDYLLSDEIVNDETSTLNFTIGGDTSFRAMPISLNCEGIKRDSSKKVIQLGDILIRRK